MPETLLEKIEKAELLGRGCGTFPVAKKWQSVLNSKEKERYVICNVSESEPGIFKDEFILDHFPEKVIEGINLAMKEVGAVKGFIYLKPIYYSRFKNKLQILIGDDKIEIFAKPAPDYIGGEESAMVNIMEGKREQPRYKPPYVTEVGFLGKPTVVNNCETFYSIALIDRGEYNQERFFCISGDRTNKGVFKYPEKMNIREVLVKSGNYPDFKFFVQLGGAMAGVCLREDQLEDYVIQHYSGLIVHELDKSEEKLVERWLSFFRDESCGQCVPCREGTYRLYEMYKSGEYNQKLFNDVMFAIDNSTLCSFGKMAITAIGTYYTNIKRNKVEINSRKCEGNI